MEELPEEQPLDNVVNFLIEQTARQFKRYSQQKFDELKLNITIEQWVLLKIIHQQKTISQTNLATLAVKDTAFITRMVDILEKKGLVIRQSDDEDRRKYNLALTTPGEQFVAQHMPLVHALRMKTIEGLTAEEIIQLKAILLKIRQNTQ